MFSDDHGDHIHDDHHHAHDNNHRDCHDLHGFRKFRVRILSDDFHRNVEG
jgi:hypothetical protein